MLPAGADTVIMQENPRTDAQQVWPIHTPPAGDNIRRAGEDIAPGSQVLPKGHRVGPVDVALLASVGIAKAWVYRRLRSEEHTSELQSRGHLVCRLLLEKKKRMTNFATAAIE